MYSPREAVPGRSIAILVVAALCLGVVGAGPAFGAAQTYTGGVYDYPLYVANDHTALALRWEATDGLAPETAYYVKLRFTVGTSPSPATNRGFTWNATTSQWVHGSAAWSEFQQVTTDAAGQVTGSAGWLFGKFGDDRASGEYYVMVSLKPVAGGDTLNPLDPPSVTVMDMRTQGSWMHNGTATGSPAEKRAEVTDDTDDTMVYALGKTEANLVDDDSDGVGDNEEYGPAGTTGDVRLAVPDSEIVDVLLNRVIWRDDQLTGKADTDIAVGAADQTPPAAPGTLQAEWTDTSAILKWGAAAGASAYRVYRWVEPLPTAHFTPVHEQVAEVTGTSYTDNGADLQTAYSYEVRAVDGAGNIGPRSNTVTNVPVQEQTVERVAGLDRYETAVAISQSVFESASRVVLATGAAYPDALAAAGLAGLYDCPVLLTTPNALPAVTAAEIARLGATKVVIVGEVGAVSQGVQDELAKDYGVSRIGGIDRYATAAAIAEEIVSKNNADMAFFARGDEFADALAAGPYAFGAGLPILLVRPGAVPPATSAAVADLSLSDGIVVGGAGAISDATLASLDAALPGAATRVFGATRYETAIALAEYGIAEGLGAPSWRYVGLATGENFPDALAGGIAAGKQSGVLLLTRTGSLPISTRDTLAAHVKELGTIAIFGGSGAVAPAVEEEIRSLLE